MPGKVPQLFAGCQLLERMSRRDSARAAALCLLLAAGGCAPGMARSDELDPAVQPVGRCGPESLRDPLPNVAALLDTARLSASLDEMRRSTGLESGSVVMTLWFEPDGLNIRRDPVLHTMTPEAVGTVQDLVFASLRKAPEREAPWGARLLIQMDGRVGYAIAPREYCPPRPLSAQVETELASYIGAGLRYRNGVRERVMLMRLAVDPLGFVYDAVVERGGTAGGSYERRLRDELRSLRFYPAVLDGVPVHGEILVPIRVRG
jgi:hypothetical protein